MLLSSTYQRVKKVTIGKVQKTSKSRATEHFLKQKNCLYLYSFLYCNSFWLRQELKESQSCFRVSSLSRAPNLHQLMYLSGLSQVSKVTLRMLSGLSGISVSRWSLKYFVLFSFYGKLTWYDDAKLFADNSSQ